MKRFLFSVALCTSLLLIGLFVFIPSSQAGDNVLVNLLNLPAPPPPNPLITVTSNSRDEKFYDKKNPPPDDAPIEDLLDYWRHQNEFDPKYAFTVKPSEKSLARLLGEFEKNPELVTGYLTILPETDETANFVKKLYDDEIGVRNYEKSWRNEVKKWLTYHTDFFSEELLQTAQQAAETEEYVTNQDEVLALARVDWEKARPLLEKMLGSSDQPVSQTLARWAFYQHALATNDSSEIEKYRKELQETVENKNLKPGNRDLAMDALVRSGDFAGRDEWYASLLEDETLHELRVNGQLYTGLTTMALHNPTEKYVEKMIELVASNNPTVRNAAIRNLAAMLPTAKNPEIAKALLPWLENPKWAKEVDGERRKILEVMRNYAIPESVPGLIAILNEKEKQEISISSNSNTNVAIYSSNRVASNVANVTFTRAAKDYYPYRSSAIAALEKQKDSRAAQALRQVLPQVENWERQTVVRALLASNGFSIAEQIEALEIVAKSYRQMEAIRNSNVNMASNTTVVEEEFEINVSNSSYATNSAMVVGNTNAPYLISNPNDTKSVLGSYLITSEEVGGELVTAVLDRIGELETKDPSLAATLRWIIQNWKGAAINSLLLRELKNGRANVESVLKLLTARKELREKQRREIYDIRTGSATALGISACLLDEPNEYEAILADGSAEAKTALLGCARLIRAALPIQNVAENLKTADKLLATAAERYLEAEDSMESRQIVLARHPNEAKILGAKGVFLPDGASPVIYNNTLNLFASVNPLFQNMPPYFFYSAANNIFGEDEKALQKEIKEKAELFGIYAYDGNFIRIYTDKAVFSWTNDPARYHERTLTAEEFENFKNFLAASNVDEFPPFLSPCGECEIKQLLMLGKQGGRRVFLRAAKKPQFFIELEAIFAELRKPSARLRYRLEETIPGLEILWADEQLQARNLWKDGADFRLLIEDVGRGKTIEKEIEELEEKFSVEGDFDEAEREKLIVEAEKKYARAVEQKKHENFIWHRFDKNKLADAIVQPSLIEHLPLLDNFAVNPAKQRWRARAGSVELRADEEGLYKISSGQLTKIRSGYYESPLVTPNGRWAIATKYRTEESEEEGYGASLVRVNLATGKEFKVKIEPSPSYEAVAFLPALNKVLVFAGYSGYEENAREGEYFLLDAETGLAQKNKGEIRPLIQQTYRPLQPTGAVNEFWAAIYDYRSRVTEIGHYNTANLTFKPLIKLPGIELDSMNIWADAAERKIYFVYAGHLLALPLASPQK